MLVEEAARYFGVEIKEFGGYLPLSRTARRWSANCALVFSGPLFRVVVRTELRR
jgi:hypothetical protein